MRFDFSLMEIFKRSIFVLLAMGPGILAASATTTGVPQSLSVSPGTVRAGVKASVIGTVTLANPSPSFFVCEVRSEDEGKIGFRTIIFKKGQLFGMAPGFVHWANVHKNCAVKVKAFSVDDPNVAVWFTVNLKLPDDSTGNPP